MSDGVTLFIEQDLRECIDMAVANSVIVQMNDSRAFVVSGHVKGVGPDADRPPFSVAGADESLAGAVMHCRMQMKKIRREPI